MLWLVLALLYCVCESFIISTCCCDLFSSYCVIFIVISIQSVKISHAPFSGYYICVSILSILCSHVTKPYNIFATLQLALCLCLSCVNQYCITLPLPAFLCCRKGGNILDVLIHLLYFTSSNIFVICNLIIK